MLLGACRSAVCCWAVSKSLSIEGWTRHCDTICLGTSAATFYAVSSMTFIETAALTPVIAANRELTARTQKFCSALTHF